MKKSNKLYSTIFIGMAIANGDKIPSPLRNIHWEYQEDRSPM